MKKNLILFLVVLFVATMTISYQSCKKDDTVTNIVRPPVTPPHINYLLGLGNIPGKPVGTNYSLPSNFHLTGPIMSDPGKALTGDKQALLLAGIFPGIKTDYTTFGSGTYVNLYVGIRNITAQNGVLIIPSGLIFCSEDTTDQSGIIIQPDTIPIPGNDTVLCCLKSYCLNLHHSPPSNAIYKMTVTTLNPDLVYVVSVLRNKKPVTDASQIQSIIWNITDNGGITQSDKTYLNSLP